MSESESAQAAPSETWSRFKLPGLNLPLNWTPGIVRNVDGEGRPLFKTALSNTDISDGAVLLPLTTLREFTMLHIMNSLTDKPNWHEKVFDDEIAQKWKTEAMAMEGRDVSQLMVDCVIDELRWKAGIFKETGAVSVYNGDVVKSDLAISESIKHELREAARELEDVPDACKDWHPGSNGQVLDLVHPSLFPLVFGKTRVIQDELIHLKDCLESCCKGVVVPPPNDDELGTPRGGVYPYSKNFQWLPCEVDISNEDGSAKIMSYINNLHPHKHQKLYSIIESIIAKAIPLWNMTLSPLREDLINNSQRIDYRSVDLDVDPEEIDEEDKPQQESGETEDEYYDRVGEWEDEIRTYLQPEPYGGFNPPNVFSDPDKAGYYYDYDFNKEMPKPGFDIRRDYTDRGLQVIIKLANIHLTPENSEYEGGSWHVEGQLNEHICATALYYYDSENITDSQLAFRQASLTDEVQEIGYPQNVHGWLTEIFGCHQDGPAVQTVGSVSCREGRLLTFPNILQHQVQPFKLADPTKPGHRKILALFLVDPGIRIISTANVPPQQKEWWSEHVRAQAVGKEMALGKLSTELKDMIFEQVDDFPISMEEAKELRLQLMAERSIFVSTNDDAFEERTFNLCEH